jgi:hypothetical protein
MPKLGGFRLFLTAVLGLLVILGLGKVGASSANISHSYRSNVSIPNGSIVSLDPSKTNFVELASTNNGKYLTGVALNTNDSLLAEDSTVNTDQVATSGNVNTLVSTINGNINVGDSIAVSPFNGVGMEGNLGSRLIGLAETSFNSKTSGATEQMVKDKQGQSRDIWVGYVRLSIAIGTESTVGGKQINSLQRAVKDFSGRTVPTLRIVTSMSIALVALIGLVTLIYASIYGSIISIGRNPLAKHSVFRTLGGVIFMTLIVAGIAGAAIFFLLR